MKAFWYNDRDYYQVDAMCNKVSKYKNETISSISARFRNQPEDVEDFAKGTIDFIGLNYYVCLSEPNRPVG